MMANFVYEAAPGIDLQVDDFNVAIEDAGRQPTNIINTTDAWTIRVRWEEAGLAAGTLPGNWHLDAFVESIGSGDEKKVGDETHPMGPAHTHTAVINVPAGALVPAPGEKATPYKLVITITADKGTTDYYPLAGYQEGPLLLAYETP